MASKWLNRLNPFQGYFEYKVRILENQARVEAIERAERQEERAAFLTALQSITTVAVESAKVSQAHAGAMSTFLNSFQTTSNPVIREWDEEADNKRYLENHLPPEMVGLDKLGQFELLLDRLDRGD